jgi:DNA-binding transcriptional LysR family regulator
MTLQQIKYVITVANTNSMNEAAKQLFIAQPSLSTAIKELEEEIGFSIFFRSRKGVELTPEGKEFLGYIRQVSEQFSLVEDRYLKKQKRKSRFSVSAQHYSFVVKAFVETVRQFGMDEYEFSIKETKTHTVIEDVQFSISEIGIIYLNEFNEKIINKLLVESNLEFTQLIQCKAYVYLWKGNPLAKQDCLTLQELEPYPCLAFDQGSNSSFYLAEEILSVYQYKRLIRANDRATILNLMRGLNGYTLCSGIICEELNGQDYIAVPLKSDEIMRIGYITRKNSVMSEIGKAYINELIKYTNGIL